LALEAKYERSARMKMNIQKSIIGLVVLFAVALLSTGASYAASTANHTVTIKVNQITQVAIQGGTIVMTIDSAVPGQQPDPVTDASCSLHWTVNGTTAKKIQVQSNAAIDGGLTLSVTLGGGAPVGITTTAQDVRTGIVAEASNDLDASLKTLTYQATATVAAPVTSRDFTITYTITE
jgi:hypothetical protein